jgi:hypothetical protein
MAISVGPPGVLPAKLSARARIAILQAAGLFVLIAACLLAVVLVSDSANGGRVHVLAYPASNNLRIAMFFASFTMFAMSGSVLSIDLSMSSTVGFTESSTISTIHCLGVGTSALLISIVGLTVTPLIRNAQNPRLIASLDVLLLPFLRMHMHLVLREVLYAQGSPSSPLVLPSGFFGWVMARSSEVPYMITLGVLQLVTVLGFMGSRLMTDRTAAAVVLAVAIAVTAPAAITFSNLVRVLIRNARVRMMRFFAYVLLACGIASLLVTLICEPLYQFGGDGVLPFEALLPDAAFCLALYPISLLGMCASSEPSTAGCDYTVAQ